MFNKIFIVSTGRTGTLSLAQSLDKVKGIRGTHEAFHGARELSNRLWDHEVDAESAKQVIRDSLQRHRELYDDSVWIDSNCLLWNFIDLLDEVCEEQVGYIYVFRNAEDTIQSMFATAFYRADAVPWERRAKRGFIDIRSPDYSDEDRLQNCRHGYRIRTQRIEECLDRLPAERQLRLPFEEMVSDPEKMREIVAFISSLTHLDIKNAPKLVHRHRRPPAWLGGYVGQRWLKYLSKSAKIRSLARWLLPGH